MPWHKKKGRLTRRNVAKRSTAICKYPKSKLIDYKHFAN